MENRDIARLLYETADLMEINGDDPFRIRSYRNAAQSLEAWPARVFDIVCGDDIKGGDKQLLAIPSIGKGMVANLREVCKSGELALHRDLIQKFGPGSRELLNIQGLGPKTINLIWSSYHVSTIEEVEQLCREGKLAGLPRLGKKLEEKVLRSIESYRRSAGRFLISTAERAADEVVGYLKQGPGAGHLQVTCAGSLRRGKETIGDIDVLVTGGAPEEQIEHMLKFPRVLEVVARGENKVSV